VTSKVVRWSLLGTDCFRYICGTRTWKYSVCHHFI